MFQSERMKKVNVLALERDVDSLMVGLGQLRAIHLTPAATQPEGRLLAPSGREDELTRLVALDHRIERLAGLVHVTLEGTLPETPEEFVSPDEVITALDRVEPEVDRILARQQTLGDEAGELRGIIARVESFEGTALAPSRIGEFSFVHFALGAIDEDRLDRVRSEVEDRVLLVPFRETTGRQKVLAITSKKGRFALDSTLQKHGFAPEEATEEMPGLPDEVLARARKRLADVLDEHESLEELLGKIGETEGPNVRRYWRQLRVRQKILRAHENLGRTRSTYLVSGWVPEVMVETFVHNVLELTEHRTVIEILDPEELPEGEEPPTALRHSTLVRPFAMLVSGFGCPTYREIEPTVLVAISFFAMFGAMFGDVGQGAVLVLAGLMVRRWASKETAKDFGLLIAICGVSAVIFGFVYGSIFGKEGIIEPLWGLPMKNVLTLFVVSVAVGVAIISMGVVLNVLNKLRRGNWASAVFGRFGLAGIAFYWGALGLAVKYAWGGGVSVGLAAIVILIPLALLFLREPVMFVLHRPGKKPDAPAREGTAPEGEPAAARGEHRERGVLGFFIALIGGLVEVLEAALIYMANTASFVRLAAFALSHAVLCMVIFALTDSLAGVAGGAVWSVLLIVVGNVVVIAFEGLIVAVQTVRLEYYEFFSKFFSGEGTAFKPFDIRSQES